MIDTPQEDMTFDPVDRLNPTHVEKIAAITRDLAKGDPWKRLEIDADRIKRAILQNSSDCHAFLACCKSTPAGVMTLRWPWLFGVYIQQFAVLRDHRGTGVGSAMMSQIETLAQDRKFQNIWLCVSGFNTPAQHFYRRFGFDQVGELAGLIVPDEDELLMRKRLS